MSEAKALEILKQAILLETRGRAFYAKVAKDAEEGAVKTFFETMAQEEEKHVEILSDQFKSFKMEKKFCEIPPVDKAAGEVAPRVLTDKLKEQISAAGFEAAAIAAAMGMEIKAIQLYSERASAATDPEEKELYQWLADWEKTHLELLSKLEQDLTQEIWNDNQFWPM